MEELTVRIPEPLMTAIDDAWEHRGYASKAEAVRDALRTWVEGHADPRAKTFEELVDGNAQEGDTADELRRDLGF